jgi:transposase
MSKTYASAIPQLLGEPGHVIERFHGVQLAVDALEGGLRSGQKQRTPEEAKDLKKLRKRWRKSANQLNVDAWIARDEWRRRFPEWREVIDWVHNVRTWFERQ